MSLEFYEDTHTYTLDGEEIPSVSEILRFISREVYQEPDKFLMDQAADRGKRVHKAAEELDRQGVSFCDGDIEGYVKAYRNFLHGHKVEWNSIEKPVYNRGAWYAGTLDRAGWLDGKPVILDIKTTKTISKKHKLMYATQLTAYACTSPTSEVNLYILQLRDDGSYKLIKVEEQQALWVACLMLHNEFEKTKRRIRDGRKTRS